MSAATTGWNRLASRNPGRLSRRRYGTRDLVELGYRLVLGRDADEPGARHFCTELESGRLDPAGFVRTLGISDEARERRALAASDGREVTRHWLDALHAVRCRVITGLPRARRIVDLGGSCENWPEGAMVVFGYPYPFERLTIVDLPRDQRHAIYENISGEYNEAVTTRLGTVDYVYTSMADLAAIPDASVDLVYSGQSIEHVTRADAALACREVARILRPGGSFCLDTPNRAVTRVEFPEHFINPDHKHEYTHAELAGLLDDHGFVIREAKGLCWLPESVATGHFRYEEGIRNAGMYDDLERCYLLYYNCRKPA